MKRTLAILLIITSLITFLLTIFWIYWETTHPSRYPNKDSAVLLGSLAGVLILLESILFLTGLYLLYPCPDKQTGESGKPNHRNLFPVLIYLGGSFGVGLFSAMIFITSLQALKPLWILTCPPFFLSQTLLSVFGIKFDSELSTNVVLSIFSLIYYFILFYPVYSLSTIDRTLKSSRYKLMKIFVALFCAMHFLIMFLLMVLIKA